MMGPAAQASPTWFARPVSGVSPNGTFAPRRENNMRATAHRRLQVKDLVRWAADNGQSLIIEETREGRRFTLAPALPQPPAQAQGDEANDWDGCLEDHAATH